MKHYMDAFAADLLPAGVRKTLAVNTVPALVEAIHQHNAAPMLGHDLRTIADIQHGNANRMRLFQPFNPEYQDYDESNTVVITVERDGVPVACAGTRLLWIERSLGEAFQSLNLFYRDVAGMSRADEVCVCTAPTAWTIVDCPVAFTGAVFTQQGEDPAIARAMMRLLHLWVYAHWRWSWLTGIAEKAIVRSYAHDVYGYPMAETGLAREGRWYWLLLGPRSFYRRAILDRSFRVIDTPLCLPTADEIRGAGGRPGSSTFRIGSASLGA
jgi:hypothetical protein